MKSYRLIILFLVATGLTAATAQVPTTLNLKQSLDLALKQNPTILKAREELKRTRGLIVEVRAEALPNATASGTYTEKERRSIDVFPGATQGVNENQERPWSAAIEVSQLLYSGGRVRAAVRAAKLTDQISVLDLSRTVADVVLDVRKTFYQILLNTELVSVREQSIKLLEQQLADTKHRFDVGAVAQFNVLRAEVELANARPPLIRAQNDLRLSREALVKLLAIDTAGPRADFTPIRFEGKLTYEHQPWQLPDALAEGLAKRPEVQQAEKRVALNREGVRIALAGYQPALSAFAGYGIHDSPFFDDVDHTTLGWYAGARVTWNVFDGMLTRGKVQQARAQFAEAQLDAADTRRATELEVRQAYSDYLQALQLIEAQKKTGEQAEESLRLAEARFRAGTGTQLDVLSAQTALTEARSNEVQALHDYSVAIAGLERAAGRTVTAE